MADDTPPSLRRLASAPILSTGPPPARAPRQRKLRTAQTVQPESLEEKIFAISKTRSAAMCGTISTQGRVHRQPERLENGYEVDESVVLGTGMSGSVHLARSLLAHHQDRGGQPVRLRAAVKSFNTKDLCAKAQQQLMSEVEIFMLMDHPNVARLLDVYISEEAVHLVMECMEGGELIDRHRNRPFSEHSSRDSTWQMLLAIRHMHAKGVVHRDLKPQNFLYEGKRSRVLKLIDFGLSKFVLGKKATITDICGSVRFMAPEVWSENYDSQCDMWSLGVIVFRLLMGYLPFVPKGPNPKTEDWAAATRCGYKLDEERVSLVSQHSIDFVKRLLVVDPNERMTPDDAVNHPWLAPMQRNHRVVSAALVEDLVAFASMSKFRRACMHLAAWSLGPEQLGGSRQDFLQMDKDRDGKVSLPELKKLIQAEWEMSHRDVELIFSALDENDDGEISFSEFLATTMAREVEGNLDLIKEVFNRFDKDRSGAITADNLRQVLGEDAPVERIVCRLDLDSDGEISFDEFVEFMQLEDDAQEEPPAAPGGHRRRRQRSKTVPAPRAETEPAPRGSGEGGESPGGSSWFVGRRWSRDHLRPTRRPTEARPAGQPPQGGLWGSFLEAFECCTAR